MQLSNSHASVLGFVYSLIFSLRTEITLWPLRAFDPNAKNVVDDDKLPLLCQIIIGGVQKVIQGSLFFRRFLLSVLPLDFPLRNHLRSGRVESEVSVNHNFQVGS